MWVDPICRKKKKKKDWAQMCLLFWKHFLIMTILRTGHCLSCVTSISNSLLYQRSHYISPFLIYMFVSFSWLCDP